MSTCFTLLSLSMAESKNFNLFGCDHSNYYELTQYSYFFLLNYKTLIFICAPPGCPVIISQLAWQLDTNRAFVWNVYNVSIKRWKQDLSLPFLLSAAWNVPMLAGASAAHPGPWGPSWYLRLGGTSLKRAWRGLDPWWFYKITTVSVLPYDCIFFPWENKTCVFDPLMWEGNHCKA